MIQPNEIIQVNGPVVEMYKSEDYSVGAGLAQSIVYSVSLANGLVVTSPDKFPNSRIVTSPLVA